MTESVFFLDADGVDNHEDYIKWMIINGDVFVNGSYGSYGDGFNFNYNDDDGCDGKCFVQSDDDFCDDYDEDGNAFLQF